MGSGHRQGVPSPNVHARPASEVADGFLPMLSGGLSHALHHALATASAVVLYAIFGACGKVQAASSGTEG